MEHNDTYRDTKEVRSEISEMFAIAAVSSAQTEAYVI